ncbi:unnamed protein product [Colias eurytheme]|nr:unnamed protein product [Colias eurytheme]
MRHTIAKVWEQPSTPQSDSNEYSWVFAENSDIVEPPPAPPASTPFQRTDGVLAPRQRRTYKSHRRPSTSTQTHGVLRRGRLARASALLGTCRPFFTITF